MRHNRQTHRFNRNPKERRAMLENLVGSLLYHQEITTTLPKAKAAKRLADRMITLGKNDSLASRRQAFSTLQSHELISKLFKEIAPRFKSRHGGYTRILQLQRRKGDGAQLALLELTEKEIKIKATPAKAKLKKDAKDEKGKAVPASHTHEEKEDQSKAKTTSEKETHLKRPEIKKEQPKGGFFKNIGKFFRNKGGS